VRRFTPLLLLLAGGAAACTTDDDALAKRSRPASGGSGGQGTGGSGGGGGGDAAAGAAGAAGGELGDAGDESDASSTDEPLPVGPGKLTIVHGVADASELAFCFERVSGTVATPLGSVQPASALGYARAFVFETPAGFDATQDSLRPIVLAGDLSSAFGKSCAEVMASAEPQQDLDAGDAASDAGAGLVSVALPVLPAGTLYSGRDLLLVAAGCLGGPTHTDPSEQYVCGTDYRPDRPTLTALIAASARASVAGKVALQVMNGSPLSESVDFVVAPPAPDTPSVLVSDVVAGAIAPEAPLTTRSAADFFASAPDSLIQIDLGGSPAVRVPFPTALAQGGLSALENGRSYAFVLIGPRAAYSAANWWQAPTVTVLSTSQ
jgi:hypothetical protein